VRASFESIPKRRTNATKVYLAGYVPNNPLMFYVYWSPMLVVVIGKTRVKTRSDDDRCPQDDQYQPDDPLGAARFPVRFLTLLKD
jgi:hypothetical protein